MRPAAPDWSRIRLCVQGEAPGREEAVQGRPFVGPSGHWIRRNILYNAGILESEVFFDNTLRCLPPAGKGGEPYPSGVSRRAAERECRQYDHSAPVEIPLLCAGGKASGVVYGNEKISEIHGSIEIIGGRVTGCTYHPAAVIRNPNLLPVAIRETANLLAASRNPLALQRPEVFRGAIPEIETDFVFDLEWDTKNESLLAVGVAYESGRAYSTFGTEDGLAVVESLIEKGHRAMGHNIIGADLGFLRVMPRSFGPEHVFDTMIVAHLVHPHFAALGMLGLGDLVRYYAPVTDWKKNREDLLLYNGYDCAYNFRLAKQLEDDVTATEQWHLIEKQQTLAYITRLMHEEKPIRLDADALVRHAKELLTERGNAKKYFEDTHGVNPGSPSQIIKFAASRKIRISDAQFETLARHRGKDAEFDKIIAYREDTKALSTWFPVEAGKDGSVVAGDFVRPHFSVTGTAVARFSCSDPNFQNLPPELRVFIVPRSPECDITAFDFSQIENRTVAYIAGDFEVLEAWRSYDPYRITAALMFGVKYADVTKEQRKSAKITELASIYGETPFNLARRMFGGTRRDHVQQAEFLQEAYFRGRPKVRAWQRRVESQYEAGAIGFRNPFGRHRAVYAQSPHEFKKRACHYLGCSTAADIMNQRVIDLWRELKILPALIVHDEVMFDDLPRGDWKLRLRIAEILQAPVPQMNGFSVPVVCKHGPNYGALTELSFTELKEKAA